MDDEDLIEYINDLAQDAHVYHKVPGISYNDLHQVAHLAACEALELDLIPEDKEFTLYIQASLNRYKSHIKGNYKILEGYARSIASVEEETPETLCENKELQELVSSLRCKLTLTEQYIIQSLFYATKPLTLEQIAEDLKITKERVHFLKKRAITKLRGLVVNG